MAYQAQPYRAPTSGRRESAALRAMTRGRGPLRYNGPGETRAAAKKRKRRRKSRARYKTPLHKVLATRRSL